MRDYSWICRRYTSLKLRLVVLYGSRARGDHLEDSDVDILVVADELPRDPREAYMMLLDPEHPEIQPLGMNTRVFTRKLREASTFILEILEDGIIICGDPQFQEEVMREYEKARRQYERRGKTWVRRTTR